MRSKRMMRRSRPLNVAAGALMLTVPTSAVALAVSEADAQSATQIDVSRAHVGFDKHVRVTGSAPATSAGQPVVLEYARGDGSDWKPLKTTKVAPGGSFRFVLSMRKSGLLRAVVSNSGVVGRSTIRPASTNAGTVPPSASQRVSVGSRFDVRHRSIDVLGGQTANITGRLLPSVAGRKIRLESHSRRGWHVVGSARTGSHGGFRIRYRPAFGSGGARGEQLRVEFRGDGLNTSASDATGRVRVFERTVASWYNDGGSTACGFHAGLGVANRSLPCGTKVTFHYGRRTVTATVDDRGPYVGGRDWDLNQTTAGALGFGGVGTVWSTS